MMSKIFDHEKLYTTEHQSNFLWPVSELSTPKVRSKVTVIPTPLFSTELLYCCHPNTPSMKGVSIMTKQERSAYWRSLVSKQIDSGLTAAESAENIKSTGTDSIIGGVIFETRSPVKYIGAFIERVP